MDLQATRSRLLDNLLSLQRQALQPPSADDDPTVANLAREMVFEFSNFSQFAQF